MVSVMPFQRGIAFWPQPYRLCAIVCTVLVCEIGMQGQNSPNTPSVPQLAVRHIHDSGWNSHQLVLELNSEALLISGPQQLRGFQGIAEYCIFPAEIPLESIVSVEAKSTRFKPFSSIYAMRLHLEYKDEHGKAHGYDFIPINAVQTDNEWSGGDADSILDFAAELKIAIELRSQQLKPASAVGPQRLAKPQTLDPDSGLPLPNGNSAAIVAQGGAEAGVEDSPAPNKTPQRAAQPVVYVAQMPWRSEVRRVNIWPVSPRDHTRFLVEDSGTKNILINVYLEDLSSVGVKQRVVKIADPSPDLVFSLPLGPAQGPRVYELCLSMHLRGSKKITNCFISEMARCMKGTQCEEGEDGGRSILAIEKEISKAIEGRSDELKRTQK